MSLKRLAIRTKKSLSGLHAFSSDRGSPTPETPRKSHVDAGLCKSPGLEEFGLSPASSGTDSPSKSLSKRSRFKNSLRRMRSGFGSPKEESHDEPVVAEEQQITPVRPRPSLALNFEASPPGKLIFDPSYNSSKSSGVNVPHSSPIAVPNVGQHDIVPGRISFPSNTVPKSPAPLTKACVQESIVAQSVQDGKTVMPCIPAIDDPRSIPIPGTNLTLEDIQTPEIVVSSPAKAFKDQSGYFNIPVQDGPQHETGVTMANSTAPNDIVPANVPRTSWSSIDLGPRKGKRAEKEEKKAVASVRSSTGTEDDDPFALDTEARKPLEGKNDFVNAYLAREARHDGGCPLQVYTCEHRRRSSGWGRHTGLYDGTGYATSDLDESVTRTIASCKSEASKSEESTREKSETTTINEQSTGPTSMDGSVAEDSANEKETLQEIIRAYAFTPELDEDEKEINEQAVSEIGGSLSESASNAGVGCESIQEEIAEDVAASIRVMNRSLGG